MRVVHCQNAGFPSSGGRFEMNASNRSCKSVDVNQATSILGRFMNYGDLHRSGRPGEGTQTIYTINSRRSRFAATYLTRPAAHVNHGIWCVAPAASTEKSMLHVNFPSGWVRGFVSAHAIQKIYSTMPSSSLITLSSRPRKRERCSLPVLRAKASGAAVLSNRDRVARSSRAMPEIADHALPRWRADTSSSRRIASTPTCR